MADCDSPAFQPPSAEPTPAARCVAAPQAAPADDAPRAVQVYATGWNGALARPPKVKLAEWPPQGEPLRAVSFVVTTPAVKTFDFIFPENADWALPVRKKKPQPPVKADDGSDCVVAAPAPEADGTILEFPQAGGDGAGGEPHPPAEDDAAAGGAAGAEGNAAGQGTPAAEGAPADNANAAGHPDAAVGAEAGSGPAEDPAAAAATRIKPPKDIVKLEDRLYYLLQPPLEQLVATTSLHLPFEPFPYQFQGIAFLYPRHSAVLADEMGLGKTMQAISTIRLLLCAGEVRRVLLICPKPLVTNWKREFGLWAPEVPLAIVEGDHQRRKFLWEQNNVPVKIANYELLMRDRELLAEAGKHFDLVVLDEAQRIKNRGSATSEIVRSISRSRSWALTGTPVENSPDDLVGIFEFLSPGYLQPGMRPTCMAEASREYVLRRTKDLVLTDMPPKMYRDAQLTLTPEQQETYQLAEEEGVVRLNALGEGVTVQHVFELVLRLKQICNFDPVTGASCKLERLEADLEEVAASGKKAIVFSQWVQTLDKIGDKLARFNPLQYSGRTPSKQRDGVLKQFRENPENHVILMSYGAGSVGLNLQFCQYVFLFDRWWNPAIEDQAINRAHRIGAAGAVTVTRMIAANTIEERIHQVLEDKRELFKTIFANSNAPPKTGLTAADIFGLFNLRTPKGPLKAAA